MEQKKELVIFETKDHAVKLEVPVNEETVWLTQEQMSKLFDTARSSIAYHISNIFKEKELEESTSVEIFDRSANSSRPPKFYNMVRSKTKHKHIWSNFTTSTSSFLSAIA